MFTEEKKFTVKEVADQLRLSKRTVERFIEKGELKYHRFGSRIVVTASQLNAFAEKKRIKFFWMSVGDLPDLSFDSY
jgi:excisionase family DNA binding protein